MMIMSVDLVGKTRQQPREGSLLRPRPIGRDRVVLSRGQACRCYACACVGRGAHKFRETFASALCPMCTRNLLFGKLDALAGAAIGEFRVQLGRSKTLNHQVPVSRPGAPTKPFQELSHLHRLRGANSNGFQSVFFGCRRTSAPDNVIGGAGATKREERLLVYSESPLHHHAWNERTASSNPSPSASQIWVVVLPRHNEPKVLRILPMLLFRRT